MSWKLNGSPKTYKVTRALAASIADMDGIPQDRPLSERRLLVYRKLLDQEKFRPVTWATCECQETGTTYRINGKHTSTLLSSLDRIPEFYVTIERYKCETLEDAAKLYATFDSAAQTRTAKEIYLSFAGTVPALREIPGTVIYTCGSGIAYATMQSRTWESSAAERAELMIDEIEFISWFNELIHGGTRGPAYRTFNRAAVIGAVLLCFRKDEPACKTFWPLVRDETGSAPDQPDRVLARWLATTVLNRGAGSRRGRIAKADNREFFVKCIHAWNAWRNKESRTKLQYSSDAPVPKLV